ncbi:porin [Dechloromonas sp.]|uniref:porin n=1 Tax=Dechloromonas sp. TaxID=1917218 RepID=UPI00216EF677|nr:porin [Dechloromonas sp.]MBU3698074.1 porin [Dechloromonas sp.]
MQKKIIALAIAGLASTAAFAQTNVQIYGILDASAYAVDANGNNQANYGFSSSANTTSRLGFKGVEDLGNGLKANFNLETEIAMHSGVIGSTSSGTSAGSFSRAANVGLESKLGTVTLGRQITPLYALVAGSDVLGSNSGGLINAWVGTNNTASSIQGALPVSGTIHAGVFNQTVPNTYYPGVGLATPVIGGFQVKAFTNAGTNRANTDFADGGLRDIAVTYSGFGANVRAGYQEVLGNGYYAQGRGTSGRTTMKNTLLGADYTIGAVKLAAAWVRTAFDNPLAVSDVDTFTAGGSYKLGKTTVGASYTDTRAISEGANNASKQVSLRAGYDLSKRTSVYVQAIHVMNQGGASLAGVYGGNNIGTENTTSLLGGLRHAF